MLMSDFAIPVVFPDYLIAVNDRPIDVHIPDLIPGRDFFPDHFRIPVTKLPELGHAGILFIKGATGTTKYYEYGRYDRAKLGLVMRRPVPDVQMRSGMPVLASLKLVLRAISVKAGQKTRIAGAFIELSDGAFLKMLHYAQGRLAANTDPKREPYALTSNSCLHFMKGTAEAGGAAMPWVIDPRPAGYMDRVRAAFPPLDYVPSPESITVPAIEEALKKKASSAASHH